MKAKEYHVLHRAVEEGLQAGWNRAHKYVAEDDLPEIDAIREHLLITMHDAVMLVITEWFDFDAVPEPEEEG